MSLPDDANLEWLRKQAKQRLKELRSANPAAQLSDAQFDLARKYGFTSWRALKAHIDALIIEGRLFQAAQNGDVPTLSTLLDEHPDKTRVSATARTTATRSAGPSFSRSRTWCRF